MTLLQLADSSLLLGLLYCGVALSIILSLRILDFPDLTIEGSVPLGGAIVAVMIVSGYGPLAAIVMSMLVGVGAGIGTAIFHTRLNISKLLSGIIMLTILYSLNLRIMGSSNIGLLTDRTIFTRLEEIDAGLQSSLGLPIAIHPTKILGLLLWILILVIVLMSFLKTEVGLRLRAVGDNQNFASSVGVNTSFYTVLGLAIANALAALSGGLAAMNQGFTDVGMGQGMLVMGVASVILGEKVLLRFYGPLERVRYLICAAVVGSILYYGILMVALKLGLPPTDLKMGTAIIVLIAMALQYRPSVQLGAGLRRDY